ncbi:MAG: hypothetical protein JWN52_8084 [Actinomycetia bacterium]|nr:hypothetical protein [Actinomycetes bacterium]
MGLLRMSPLLLARLGVALGCLLFVVGIGLAVDLPAALMTAGILLAAGCLVLIDVDKRDGKEGR